MSLAFGIHRTSTFETDDVSENKDKRGNNWVKSALWPKDVTSRMRGSPPGLSGGQGRKDVGWEEISGGGNIHCVFPIAVNFGAQ